MVAVIGEGGEKSVTCQCPLWRNNDQLQCPTCSRTVARDFTLGEKIVEWFFFFFFLQYLVVGEVRLFNK
jgi:hypothetical protein